MAEEFTEPISEEAGKGAAEEVEEVIDLNARLLEVMVERTEILEKLLSGEVSIDVVREELGRVRMPSLEKRRRRKKTV